MTEKAKRFYLYSVMICMLLPSLFLVDWSGTTNGQALALKVSAVLGYIGIVFMLQMSLIGTRTVATIFFDDQVSLLKVHAWLGKYGTLFIFLHPLLITIGFGESLLYSIVSDISNNYEFLVTLGRIAIYGLLIIWVSSALLRSRMSYRVWNYLHYITYAVIPFALFHIPVGSVYAQSAAAQLYFWMIVVGSLLFGLFKLRDILMVDRTKYTIERLRRVSEHVYLVELAPSATAEYIEPQLGQYVYARLGFLSESHPFSVAQYGLRTHRLSLAFKVYGRFTRTFASQQTGAAVWLTNPTGVFTQQLGIAHSGFPPVFIAGGIGIVPFIGRITGRVNPGATLLYANQAPENAVFERQLGSILGDNLVPVYSRHETSGSEHGHVTADVITRHVSDAVQRDYFICGPAPMMAFVEEQLRALGVASAQIHQEEFTF